ncbi:hypothetical protein [Campylobacter vicugnae]|uniref:hypothetical protein n=1 Tax=Campylobacter vicugnae TaxID=1660076 RepID=UPI000A33E40D|nr:hypothetical protein [Campylobacter sp. S0112]
MALPFIAGIALGAGIAFAFSKRDEIAKTLGNLNLDKKLQDGLKASKSVIATTKETAKKSPNKKPGRKPKAKTADNIATKTITSQDGDKL